MWQRFTENARKTVFYSQEEAQRFGEGYVSTEHLLLGLIRDEGTTASRALEVLRVDRARIRHEVERQLPRGDVRPSQDMTLTPRAKRVIDLAYEEARMLNQNYIGTEHLLIGMVREGVGLAGRVLAKLGIELPAVRTAVLDAQEGVERTPDPAPPSPPRKESLSTYQRLAFQFRPGHQWRVAESVLHVLIADPGSAPAIAHLAGEAHGGLLRLVEFSMVSRPWRTSGLPCPTIAELLVLAGNEAKSLGSPGITSDHLILAFIADARSPLVSCFTKAGVTADALREAIRSLHST